MALSLTSLIDAIDKQEMSKLARKHLTVDVLPMGEIQRWLEQRWRPDAVSLLAPGSVSPSLLNSARGQSTATGTGVRFADAVAQDGFDTTSKFGLAIYHAGGTFAGDGCYGLINATAVGTTTFRMFTGLGGNIPIGQTVLVDWWVWR